jgi:hypothetical protein
MSEPEPENVLRRNMSYAMMLKKEWPQLSDFSKTCQVKQLKEWKILDAFKLLLARDKRFADFNDVERHESN